MLKKKQQEQATNNLKTPEQLQFESHWSAGPSQDKSSQPQPSTSRAVPVTQMSQKQDNYDDYQADNFNEDENFDCARVDRRVLGLVKPANEMINNMNFQGDNFNEDENFDFVRANQGTSGHVKPTNQGIPGLDYVMHSKETPKNINRVDQVVNLEEDEKIQEIDEEYVPPKEPPPLPTFKSTVAKRVLIPIDDILDVPGRNNRPER